MLATGWTVDRCLDELTPRGASFLMDAAARREARQLMQFVSIVHGEPKEVHERLRDVAFPRPVKRTSFAESLAAMAESLGQTATAAKIRKRDLVNRALMRRGGARA